MQKIMQIPVKIQKKDLKIGQKSKDNSSRLLI